MLWYNLYTSTLQGMGFELNPYDLCVANKMINGKQCTIVFYVDDNKVSHKDPKVVTEILEKMSEYFGELTISRGDKHDFLGINITLNRKKKRVELEMTKKAKDVVEHFGETCNYKVSSPSAPHLWQVNDDAEQLNQDQSEIFHSVTAELLYLTKRSRPDIEPTVSFLTTRVSKSNVDDWKKLKRCITWVDQTDGDVRLIGASTLEELYTWIDVAFAVHPNGRSHTGGNISLGVGMIHCRSGKQKLNTKSSTESELVGTSEYLPYNIWFMYFFKAQGYPIKKNILFQDNQSAIRMQKNGRGSCTGNSRHINIKHFFVKDRIDKKEVEVQFCPTHLMIADYFTKPLQGKAFKLFRDLIMGYTPISTILDAIALSAKERVEIQKIVTESSIMNNGRNGRTYADVVKERKQMSPSNTTHLLNTENKENSKDNLSIPNTHNS